MKSWDDGLDEMGLGYAFETLIPDFDGLHDRISNPNCGGPVHFTTAPRAACGLGSNRMTASLSPHAHFHSQEKNLLKIHIPASPRLTSPSHLPFKVVVRRISTLSIPNLAQSTIASLSNLISSPHDFSHL